MHVLADQVKRSLPGLPQLPESRKLGKKGAWLVTRGNQEWGDQKSVEEAGDDAADDPRKGIVVEVNGS